MLLLPDVQCFHQSMDWSSGDVRTEDRHFLMQRRFVPFPCHFPATFAAVEGSGRRTMASQPAPELVPGTHLADRRDQEIDEGRHRRR